MSYFKVGKDVPDDPRLFELATSCYDEILAVLSGPDCHDRRHALRHMTLGVLVTLWKYADTYLQSDDSLPVTLQGLATAIGAPVEMLRRFPERWLKIREDGTVELPSYVKKNRLVGKDLRRNGSERRETDRVRQQRYRAKKRQQQPPPDVTPCDTPVTSRGRHVTTGTGTGTYRPIPVPTTESLASAVGRLALRSENGSASSNGSANGGTARKPKPEPKSRATLRADARMLTSRGMATGDVVRLLAQHGVTETDVSRWIAEPEGSPP